MATTLHRLLNMKTGLARSVAAVERSRDHGQVRYAGK